MSVVRFVSTNWFWPVAIAAGTWLAIVVALDPSGDHPRLFDGPGLTVDEAFNVEQGVRLADRLLDFDLAGFRKVDAEFPDHPPLGRMCIGLAHELAYLAFPPVDRHVAFSVTCARTAPAMAFAVLVALVGIYAGRWYGRFAGGMAALALVFMPRQFGHAHLAALETMVDLTCTATVLFLAEKWGKIGHESLPGDEGSRLWRSFGSSLPVFGTAALGGVIFGLALLTKVQAILLPLPVAAWALFHMRRRALALLAVWGLVGLAVFFAFWPYLWNAPIDHLRQYLGRTTNRAVLYVWYIGEAIRDRDVPWHYPWVIFLTTVPLGLHVLGICGLWGPGGRAWKSPGSLLIIACTIFPLFVFSVPGVAVYDGERLFSLVFPLWAILIARGAEQVRGTLVRLWSPKLASIAVGLFLACQSYGLLALRPCWLSYYNLAVGGLAGATKLGLEISYWGDGVTRSLLSEVAESVPDRAKISVAPVLYDGQWDEIRLQSPILREREVQFVPLVDGGAKEPKYLLIFVRPEYLPAELRRPLEDRQILASVRREGVILAVLLDRSR